MGGNLCEVCQVPAQQSCSSCHASFYCSRECQKRAWKKHKSSCMPYTIEVHPIYGRYCVATRDIEAGEILMTEIPLAVGPQFLSRPLCLGCHRSVTGDYSCCKCTFPLCAPACEQTIYHEAECKLFSRTKVIPIVNMEEPNPAYDCILPIRCLLTKYSDPKKWKTLNNLQHSLDQTTQDWKERIKVNIINYIGKYMNIKSVNSTEIYQICGILQTNCFEVKHNGQAIAGVFPKLAMMAHDCNPNTENIFDTTMRVKVRSIVPIPKGTSVTTTYTNLMSTTLCRRKHLLFAKFFECHCLRCADPEELGSHCSTLLCSQCGGNVLSTDPLDNDALWRCADCNFHIDGKNVEKNMSILRKTFLERDKYRIKPLEDIINLCHGRLHPYHQINLEAKFSWIKFCGNHPEYRYKDLSKALLEKKIHYCRELLEISDAIFHGKSQFRGFILFELHATLKAMARKLSSFREANNEAVEEHMNESEVSLKMAKEIFNLENEMVDAGLDDKLKLLKKEFDALS